MKKKRQERYKTKGFFAAGILGIFMAVCILTQSFCTPFAEELTGPAIDFSGSQWLDEYMEEATGVCGMDFVQESAFSCGQGKGKILYIYASEKTVSELRSLYTERLQAEEHDRNDETAMHLSSELSQGNLEISNIFSQVCRLVCLNLALNSGECARIEDQFMDSFPEEKLNAVEELREILGRERHGTYVRYLYDDMNSYLYKGKPIYSCAFPGTGEEYEALVETLREHYGHNAYDSTESTWYFDIDGDVLGLAAVQTDAGKALISLLYQSGEE